MELDLELYRRDVLVSHQPRVRLSAIDVGPPDAERTIVFLHGFGGRASQWEHQLRFFADNSRAVALDLRGHGLSDRPTTSYTTDELLADLDRALEELSVARPFVLVGHSFGGALAIRYALDHPGDVEKLVLLCTADRFRLHPALGLLFKMPVAFLESIRRFVSAHFFAPAYVLKPMYHNALVVWDGRPLVAAIAVPTLAIMGHRDIAFPTASYQKVASGIPGAQAVTVPASAHLVMLERPDAVNRAIQRFAGPTPVSWREGRVTSPLLAERPWLRHYELGVPHTVRIPDQPLHRFLESAARRHPRNTAMVFYGHRTSYRDFENQANCFAYALRELGVEKGDRVMLLLPNVPQCPIAFYGALKAGAVAVLSNPLFDEAELERQVNDCGAEVIVTLDHFFDRVLWVKGRTRLKHIVVTGVAEYLPFQRRLLYSLSRRIRSEARPRAGFRTRGRVLGAFSAALYSLSGRGQSGPPIDNQVEPGIHRFQHLLQRQPMPPPVIDVAPGDTAVIHHTGGTTDRPRGVMLSHRNLVANIVQIRHWVSDVQEGKEIVLAVLPFSHSYGMTACMNLAVSLASTMVLLPQFDTKEVLEAIRDHKPTMFFGVPAMYVAINEFPRVRRFGLSSIRACISGADSLPVEVQEAFEKLTRGKLVEGYGLTEASPVTHANPLNGLRKRGSIGVPLPSTAARIVDLDTREELPPGQIGELCIRGPQVMQGYWNMPEETAAVLRDRWLHTGDVACMDEDGYFQIIDRLKDVWYSDVPEDEARPIYPRDIEEVLYEHPKVREAVVVPIGRQPKAFVVLREGERATAAELMDHCRIRLSEVMVPRWVEFRTELPKTFVGKIVRRLLVEAEERQGS